MKHTIKRLIATLSFAFASIIGMNGCALLKGLEKSCDVTFVGGVPFDTAHVTTFDNGLTPHVEKSSIPADHKPMKLIIDGQLYIMQNNKIYDINGQQIR